jgi:hypothetical protein
MLRGHLDWILVVTALRLVLDKKNNKDIVFLSKSML